MSVGDIQLDDRDFQSLVDEAKRRIAEQCKGWTEHNVSDPGITLIETFAWMTELLIYRLNRVPEKLHLALLELLDVQLEPPVPATVDLRFMLSAPAESPLTIPARETEVTTTDPNGPVFRTCDDFTIKPVRPELLVLHRAGTIEVIPAPDGTARPSTAEPAFSAQPTAGPPPDGIYLGFRDRLDRLVLRVDADVTRAKGVAIKPKDPPLAWQASCEGGWADCEVLSDTTGGFNEGGGAVELQLPRRTTAATFARQHLHWVRCVVSERTREGQPRPYYTEPPSIHRISARAVGALVRAEDAITEYEEVIGVSDETTGQRFTLRNVPALELSEGETLEVLAPGDDDWVPWELRESFDGSDHEDRHFRFEAALGEVELGPAIRSKGKGWRQHGAIPVKGAQLRMSRYRHGGGERGSVVRGMLEQPRNPIAGVASVTNPADSTNGRDAETVAMARRRAGHEYRTRHRAVTVDDFEFLAEEHHGVARCRCVAATPHTVVRVHVLPYAGAQPYGLLSFRELEASEDLREEVAEYLDERRVLGADVQVVPVPLRAVKVVVDVRVERAAVPDRVKHEILRDLYRFLNPLVGGRLDGYGQGWEFGRTLNEGDLYSLLHDSPGVSRVEDLRIYETDISGAKERPAPKPAPGRVAIEPYELICSAAHVVIARHHDDG